VFRGAICVTVPNFAALGQTVAKIGRFFDFRDGGRLIRWWCNPNKTACISKWKSN